MITPEDLQEAIAYYKGKLDPEPVDAIVLAACHYLEDRDKVLQMLEALKTDMARAGVQTYAAEPPETYQRYSGADMAAVGDYGDSDFLQAVRGKDAAEAWDVMDDLMDTLRLANPRAYESVMRKIRQI